ncbi:MAG: hypothetical protein UV59_C0007G0059 [Candidatus Gottesmanbacteria bacterium GW2011_GWA1_43_11]|uniref:HD/PDEase domain-containing protein n=1 Tax=Candidatus Gottesmanbacteria bacterium GW2011_GWA1_43_11 TaxID=1618436 RepID=A0A0G1ER00_9BACT|nr:MAG: hypothetical protein UV59_C0007G0059 [Candidatus Gottesmanbacteria bacterium GW2011_GWA1_43_11]
MLKIHDRIYGDFAVPDGVLTELMQSKPLNRLRRINQAGPSAYLFDWKTVSRFEHSVGVMLLLRKYGTLVAEQIAGLLHDVPHTAFSHVADFVFTNEHHEFHELYHETVIAQSEIPVILKKHGVPQTVIHPEGYNLLERPIPDLCADRIDYALRDSFLVYKDFNRLHLKLTGLTVRNGEFMFTSVEAAQAFADDYLEMDRESWANPREVAIYELLAQAIRHGLDKKLVTLDDLFQDDAHVMSVLKKSDDAYIQKKLKFLNPAFRIEPATKAHHHLFVKTKIRFVDPKIIEQNRVVRLTAVSPHYEKAVADYIQQSSQGWYINVHQS